jgi:hypothetical protein
MKINSVASTLYITMRRLSRHKLHRLNTRAVMLALVCHKVAMHLNERKKCVQVQLQILRHFKFVVDIHVLYCNSHGYYQTFGWLSLLRTDKCS